MQRSRRISIALCCLLMAIRWMPSHVQAVGDAPDVTTRPADELPADSPIRRWFIQLNDIDPRVRDQARFELMGIAASDLPRLRQLVIENRPLTPSQAGALHDIVMQVYLANEKYKPVNGEETDSFGTSSPFFLGVTWPPAPDPEDIRLGAIIDKRLIGFPGYRYLRKGDMIMGVVRDDTAPLPDIPNMETHNEGALRAAISSGAAQQTLELQVLRDGEVLRITLKMSPKPLYATPPESLTDFIANREEDANTYWNQNFSPLLQAPAAE